MTVNRRKKSRNNIAERERRKCEFMLDHGLFLIFFGGSSIFSRILNV